MESSEEPTEESLLNALNAINAEYEAVVSNADYANSELAELDALEKEQMKALNETRLRIEQIKRDRYNRQAEIARKAREKEAMELQLNEHRRAKELEKGKKLAFERLVQYANGMNFEWVNYAFDHQWEGALTLAHHGSALLGDGTGTGKTLTSLMYCDLVNCGYTDELGQPKPGAKKVILFVPNDMVSDFSDTYQQFAPHRTVLPLEGPNPTLRKIAKTLIDTSSEITIICNYEAVWRDVKWVSEFDWDVVGIDEAHNMKNVDGLTFDRIAQLRTKHRLPMTATFILNSPKDIFASLHMVDPGTFYDVNTFLWSYCQQNAEGKWEFTPGGENRMMKQLKGRIVQRTLKECGIILPKQEIREYLIEPDMIDEKQIDIMTQLKEMAGIALESGESISINAMIALITRERQAATYPAGIEVKVTEKMREENPELPEVGTVIFKVPEDTPSIKVGIATKRIGAVVAAGKRVVVFSQFKTALKALEDSLVSQGISVCRYDGDTDKGTRLTIKRDFIRPKGGKKQKGEYKYDVVLANYKTGGVGLTFTDATYMLCLDEEWNPAKNKQAFARIHRIGQTEETLVEILRINKSIDMWMKTLNEHKQAIVDGFNEEVSMVESFKEYLNTDLIQRHKVSEELDIDDEFLKMLEDFGNED